MMEIKREDLDEILDSVELKDCWNRPITINKKGTVKNIIKKGIEIIEPDYVKEADKYKDEVNLNTDIYKSPYWKHWYKLNLLYQKAIKQLQEKK